MGPLHRTRRTSVSLGLALLLAATGSAALGGQPAAPGVASGESSTPGTDTPQQPASLTLAGAAPSPSAGPRPAVRVGEVDAVAHSLRTVDVPDVLLAAYRSAAAEAPTDCHLPVSLLAALGEVETGSLAGRALDARHRTAILGPVLDGHGFAAVRDTDEGRLDGDPTWDRAMGPMQFVPATWATFGVDGDGDGVADPQDVEDAAASAAGFLCSGDRDLSSPAELRTAVLAYNHSSAYAALVATYQQRYARLGLDRGDTVSGAPLRLQVIQASTLGASPVTVRAVPEYSNPARRTVPTRSGTTTTTPQAGAATKGRSAAPVATPVKARPTGPAVPSTPAVPPRSAPGSPAARPTATSSPTGAATPAPTSTPTGSPTTTPAGTPTSTPTACPVGIPSDGATATSTGSPTPSPAAVPTPTATPTAVATSAATPAPVGAVPVDGSAALVCPPCVTVSPRPGAPTSPPPSPLPSAPTSPLPSPTATPSLGSDGVITCVPVSAPSPSPSTGR